MGDWADAVMELSEQVVKIAAIAVAVTFALCGCGLIIMLLLWSFYGIAVWALCGTVPNFIQVLVAIITGAFTFVCGLAYLGSGATR